MNYLYSILCFAIGFFALWFNYKDKKRINIGFNLEYIIHIRGYIGGAIFIIGGIMYLLV